MGAVSADQGLFDDAFDSNPSSVYASPCSSSSSCAGSGGSGGGYIEHEVSKMDTLAGIAIKYGVEVADVKRLNGLVTDIQMFAHKSLLIPLRGRHPQSKIHSNGSPINRATVTQDFSQGNALGSFLSLNLKYQETPSISPAMSRLQGYYGLTPRRKPSTAEETEMAVYQTYNKGEQTLNQFSLGSDPEMPIQRMKSRSPVTSNQHEDMELYQALLVKEAEDNSDTDTEKSKADKSVRRRQKADPIDSIHQEMIVKDGITALDAKTNKGLPSRPKSGSRAEIKPACQNKNRVEEAFLTNDYAAVKISPSTSSLQETDGGPSIWSSSMWSLKSDSITKPLFDGLSKPIIPWRSKNARD